MTAPSNPTRLLSTPNSEGVRSDLVLVGGGHAHVQVIRRWMMDPLPDVRLTVVLDRPEAVYSGMVPGFVAGDYRPEELEIDVVPLARRAGARVILAAATRIVPEQKRIELQSRPPIHYDVASLDVGSTVKGLDKPGVAKFALPTRPIRGFVDEVRRRASQLVPSKPEDDSVTAPRIALVGGGAAGVEIALTLEAYLRGEGTTPDVFLVTESDSILPGSSRALQRVARRELRRRGVEHQAGQRVARVEPEGLVTEDGTRLPADLVVWATGAAPIALIEASPLPKDDRGFVRVDAHFAVEGHEGLFAVGDCASLTPFPWVPKAGVHAVRGGPVLDDCLRATLRGRPLRAHKPQRDFLALLNLGEGRALGGKWGFATRGKWVWRWKDRIDRRFMERFQVLGDAAELAENFPTPEEMGMEEMPCGGCAAKVGPRPLTRALARLAPAAPDDRVVMGLDAPDDAAGVRTPSGDLVLTTIDGFRAFMDDPWWVGRVAAVNAVSDVFAKAGRPRHAMALVTVPDEGEERAEETLYQVLAGIRAALDPLRISLVGGHSTVGPELFVGLSISGDATGNLLAIGQLQVGDVLVLTSPLGTGVLLAADMQGRGRGEWLDGTLRHMAKTNQNASEVARHFGATAATDVSGFGLAGHLIEMLDEAGLAATLRLSAVPALPGAKELVKRGLRSHFHDQNAEIRRRITWPESGAGPEAELLFDPQTSGGLLIAFPADHVGEALEALQQGGDLAAARVGKVTAARGDGARILVED